MSVSRKDNVIRLSGSEVKRLVGGGDGGKAGTVHAPIGSVVTLWVRRAIERRRMARDMDGFTDAVLRDFGLTRKQAEQEVRRPFWRA